MSFSRPTARPLAWRLLPWLIPVGLILLGLVFVVTGVSRGGRPEQADLAPSNVRAVFSDNAARWAADQVGPTVATTVAEVLMVDATATGASSYRARAVIVRLDSRAQTPVESGATVPTLAESEMSTVATCVLWNVDVVTGAYTARFASEIRRESGRRSFDDIAALRDACRLVGFDG